MPALGARERSALLNSAFAYIDSAGPLGEQTDAGMRGLSIFACDLAEAARLSDGDPSVQAGRLAYDLAEWWVAAGTLAFPNAVGPVGQLRSMPDD